MLYKCNFPNCNYSTNYRHLIDQHHIIPRSLGGKNNKKNLIFVCANCHRLIHVPECTNGMHSLKNENSIIIKGWLNSTKGKILHYLNCNENNKECFYFINEQKTYPNTKDK